MDGSIKLDGQDILSMSEKEMQDIRGKKVAMIFQDPMTSLDPVMTVEEQIAEVIKLHEKDVDPMQKAREMPGVSRDPRKRGGRVPAPVLRRKEAACGHRQAALRATRSF